MTAKATLVEALDAILEERLYQNGKYGSPDERCLSIGDYLVILRGELEEAEQAFRKGVGPGECLFEVLQVGAVAAACLQQHGVVQRYVREVRHGCD
ncbi:MAG: hypothetical protein M9936_32705 [Caldilinea sp.]|nr:hypothetical protein [Caldilinea sp.]MCB9121802.1 hypothetical protein [Caldilineaceae bacterium]MCO5214486.1 hypothetical protein [Caldilinea sp.]